MATAVKYLRIWGSEALEAMRILNELNPWTFVLVCFRQSVKRRGEKREDHVRNRKGEIIILSLGQMYNICGVK